jgi:hypothetical protein
MYLRSDSAAGVRFLASMREGRGLKPSARAAGVGQQVGNRWLREAFVALREQGLSVAVAQASLGYFSPLVAGWEQHVSGRRDGRHHLAVGVEVEDAFWASFLGGETLEAACRAAGVSRASAYRWWRRRFTMLREQGMSVRSVARLLRVPREQSAAWEAEGRTAAAKPTAMTPRSGRARVGWTRSSWPTPTTICRPTRRTRSRWYSFNPPSALQRSRTRRELPRRRAGGSEDSQRVR